MNTLTQLTRVMIAGIGGASLGTEINKCLQLAGKYEVYGCDISSAAYGLYEKSFAKTYRINRVDYVGEVIRACQQAGAQWVIPGGEEPTILLTLAGEQLAQAGIRVVGNDSATVALLSDKLATFKKLEEYDIPIPKTVELANADDLQTVGLPCIVKPATGTGGSAFVFYATTADEALIYAEFIRRNGRTPIAQEYISDEEGEFTIGVLSLPDGRVVGSIALRRVLEAKLSVAYRGRGGVISSGYSQGYIDNFPEICKHAERIAIAIQSRGPLNIQGRIRNNVLIPFEINPRFSASTYLRALAGFNEVDIFLTYLVFGQIPSPKPIKPGWYLRSLTEIYVSKEEFR